MIRLAIRCRAELAERVLAELLELVPGGVEEVGDVNPAAPGGGAEEAAGRGRWVEYAIYGPPGELPALHTLEAATGAGRIEVSSTEIPDDWGDRWRDFHRPTSVAGGRLVVRPSWEEARPTADPAGAGAGADHEGPSRRRGQGVLAGAEQPAGIDLIVDPGQAFGTGAHATTRMCLELLVELADAGEARGPLADLGTGSGVLALAAARLGWDPVLGCDSEAAALEAAAENAARNGVELRLERLNLRERPAPTAPTMVANLTATLLVDVASRLSGPPRNLVCSGLLAAEVERVGATLAAAGLEPVAERASGDWAALRCRSARPGPDRG